MKYRISPPPKRVRPPRPRSRVPDSIPATPPASPYPFTPSPRNLGLTGSTRFLARSQPSQLSLHLPARLLNPIQNP